jgi:hypothetical protein
MAFTTVDVKYEVCGTCGGSGTMTNRAVSVWTEEDRDSDPEGFAAMLNGEYDVPCDECGGLRVTTEASREAFRERRGDHLLMLREQGIGPGSRDYF